MLNIDNFCGSWNSVYILTEIMEGNQLLASYLSPMILRQPDLFFEILREELFPERSNEDNNIFNTCCPIFYPANVCMGIGPNFLKPKFEKVFLMLSLCEFVS